jgi:hypothetical protein
VWEGFLKQILERYTDSERGDFEEDPVVIQEFLEIIRSMLAYRMDARPPMKGIIPRMTKLFNESEKAAGDPVYQNLLLAFKALGIAS